MSGRSRRMGASYPLRPRVPRERVHQGHGDFRRGHPRLGHERGVQRPATSARSVATAWRWASRRAARSAAEAAPGPSGRWPRTARRAASPSSAMRTMAPRTSVSRACSAWWGATSAPYVSRRMPSTALSRATSKRGRRGSVLHLGRRGVAPKRRARRARRRCASPRPWRSSGPRPAGRRPRRAGRAPRAAAGRRGWRPPPGARPAAKCRPSASSQSTPPRGATRRVRRPTAQPGIAPLETCAPLFRHVSRGGHLQDVARLDAVLGPQAKPWVPTT